MLIAVDTNILMDLAAEVESVVDALQLVRRRIADARLIVVPTVIQELRYIAKEAIQNNLNNFGHISRRKRVIPFSMKGASRNSQFSHFIIGNSFAGFIL